MSKVEAYSRGISDAYRLKNALAITLNHGVDFTDVALNMLEGKTEKRHYIITNLTEAKVLTERATEQVLMRSKYFVLGSQDNKKILQLVY